MSDPVADAAVAVPPVRTAVLASLSAFNCLFRCWRRCIVFLDRLSPVRTGGGKGPETVPAAAAKGAMGGAMDGEVVGTAGLGSTSTSGVDIGDSA